MITERTLKKWRKEALRTIELAEGHDPAYRDFRMDLNDLNETMTRILRMTQELMDLHLMRIKR